jgi:hypothetical protein
LRLATGPIAPVTWVVNKVLRAAVTIMARIAKWVLLRWLLSTGWTISGYALIYTIAAEQMASIRQVQRVNV